MIIKETKIDPKSLHFLPFKPTQKRKKGFCLVREWGNYKLKIVAEETLNTYDLLTLLFLTREYLKKKYITGYIGEEKNKKEVAKIEIDLKKFLQERCISTNKNNRITLKKSFLRLKTIELIFTDKTTGAKNDTTYIYELDIDEDINTIRIYANKKFIDFVKENGILVNLHRLLRYGNKEQYAVFLDLYLQGTKKVFKHKNRKFLKYREKYSNEELEKALKLDLTNMPSFKKRQIIKKTFKTLHEQGKMPAYVYTHDQWIRADIDRHKKVK